MEIVIGLTGLPASGKGVVADILVREYGFYYNSLSTRVREAAKNMPSVTREVLQNIGDELRKAFSGDILAKLTAGTAFVESNGRNVVIDGIRNPFEIEFFKKHPYFVLIAVIAPQKKRFQHLLKRKRLSDPVTYEDFLIQDVRERFGNKNSPLSQRVQECTEQADFKIKNNGSLEKLQKHVRVIANGLLGKCL